MKTPMYYFTVRFEYAPDVNILVYARDVIEAGNKAVEAMNSRRGCHDWAADVKSITRSDITEVII